ncbi:HD domain-containing protein [Clostridium sp. LIBA-8841]|uniref:HD domain-containing protein n=1 Tax=Clostridium sp. LIBA-8841 TaxID=2987530 RepID=UPI002AC6E264|nr:HD domain-containing protein [Clostridium sp. LIBA-8841]MDZ5253677.1 HD domain-containing protein [Clostridium sp. LIBA-8841]
MKHSECIFSCVKYIEDHITESLTSDEIAKVMGYSTYHFSRIFKEEMGVSIMEYLKDRRLLKAVEDIILGERILDVAIKYGYETNNGFTKAFRKKYGFSPAGIKLFDIKKVQIENGGEYYMDKIYENANMFLKHTEYYKEPEELYNQLVKSVEENKLFNDFTRLEKAYHLACLAHKNQKRKSDEDYVTHSINVAIILAEMETDEETIIAGLLHDIMEEKTPVTLKMVEETFSPSLAKIIENTTKAYDPSLEIKEEDDFYDSVSLIRLADRLHNMRTIQFTEPEKWREKAKEAIEMFSPIAAKLNKSKLKAELDNLALKYVN